MVFALDQRVQREHAYAIIDEVDSILIDEARTPLIISGPVGNERTTSTPSTTGRWPNWCASRPRSSTTLLAEAEDAARGSEDARRGGAVKLYQAQLGMPKNKRLLKLLNEQGVKQLVQRIELDVIADRKLPDPPAADARRRGDPLLRARREGPLAST